MLANATPDPLLLMPVALHDGHNTEPGRPFFQARPIAQREPDQENAERWAIHETVSRWLEPISRHKDQRQEPRIHFVQPVLVECSSDGVSHIDIILATTIDISFGGVGLVTRRVLPSEQVVLHISGVQIMAEVRWSRRIDNRIHRYGLRFLKVVATSR
jgi:hypothetical protein